MTMSRRLLASTLAVPLFFSVAGSPLAADKAAAKPLAATAVIAEVNGKKITKGDFDRTLAALAKNVERMTGTNAPGTVPEAVKQDLVNQLVGRELVYQEALKYSPKDLAAKVDTQIASVKASYPKPEAFQERLKSEGVTEKEFRDLVTKEIVIRNYAELQIAPKAKVSDADAKKFYEENKAKMAEPEQVRASHVLILVPQGSKPEDKQKAFAKAKEIQKKAAKGDDFAKLATENSQDAGSAKAGGDLGFFTKERMVPPFANAAFALKQGQVSDVVESTFGYHVIKLTDRKAAHQPTFDEVKPKLLPFLTNQAITQGLLARVEQLKKTAKIKILVAKPW